MSKPLSPADAKAWVHDGDELAFLDVREAGEFADGHPLFAIPCPYSRLEARILELVPRRSVRVLLIDGGDGVAARAAVALAALGYGNVAFVAGGTPAWAAAGFTLFKGVNVPSKALGELAEAAWHPRVIDAATLVRWRTEGQDFRLFDARPPAEYAKMRIPGAVCLPNGELAHRWPKAVAGDEVPVVVTCAGRTRGIIGALGLHLAGADAPVFALENGTQGWALAGQPLERGNVVEPFLELDPAAAMATRARAEAFLARHAIPLIDADEVQALHGDAERTTYLFDVRSGQEVADDPLPAFTPAPSGQLVQATDQWVGVRHAHLVLADDLGLRAGLAAYWLRLLGHEVAVTRLDAAVRAIPALPVGLPLPPPATVPAHAALRAVASGGGRFLDLRPSADYAAEHIAGAVWSLRPRLDRLRIAHGVPLYLVGDASPDAGPVTALAAQELRALGHTAVHVVAGGHGALKEAGAAVEASPHSRDEAIDFVWFAHGRHDGDLDASRLYLAWEQGLIGQLDAAERAEFRIEGR